MRFLHTVVAHTLACRGELQLVVARAQPKGRASTLKRAPRYGTLLLAAAPLFAQWPANLANIPKLPNGEPNLEAPPPKTADGKIDLSGVWQMPRRNGRQLPAAPAAVGETPLATFRDAGAGFKDGLPFTPWARETQQQRAAENSKYNPDALCLPMGVMQFHTHGQPRKIVQTPGLILIMYEVNDGLRQIFTDGRKLPVAGDVQPWFFGYSIGKWEGDTLIVETVGLREDGWLDIIGSPFTETAKITERFRRPNFGSLEIDVTVEDPKSYTKPWTVRVNHRLMPGSEMIEFICAENDTSPAHMVGK